jgi:hypothetical protein
LITSEQRRSFLEFTEDASTLTLVGAHIWREFPRLVCGAIWSDHVGQLGMWELLNSSETPLDNWRIQGEAIFQYFGKVRQRGGEHIGFFSTRAPGKPPTYEQLDIQHYDKSLIWLISTSAKGRAFESGVYEVDTRLGYSPISPVALLATKQHEVFAEQTRAISNYVEIANHEVMAWLRRHPTIERSRRSLTTL